MFKVKNWFGEVTTVYAVNKLDDDTYFLIYLYGRWIWWLSDDWEPIE